MFTVPDRFDENSNPVRVFKGGCTADEFEDWLFPLIMPGSDTRPDDSEPIMMVAGGGI